MDENEVQLLRLVGKQPEATRNALQSPAKEPKLHLSQNLGTRWGILQEALSINFVKENEWISKDSKSQSKLMHDIRLAMAQNYSEDLREEVKIAGSIAVKIHRISARVAL